MSACSSEQHSLQRVGRWTTAATLSWSGEEGDSAWFPLPTAASTNTGWEVRFYRWSNDDFAVDVRCTSLDAQFRAAAVRVVAVVEGAPRVWGEAADVLQSGQQSKWWCWFCKKVSECPEVRPLKVRVTAQWTELEHLPSTPDLWMESAAHIRCSWQLRGWKVVTPTAAGWWLWSEPFGRSGVLWRIAVLNRLRDGKRELLVGVQLQHLPASVEWSGMSWKCSLTAWSRQFDEQQQNMERSSWCEWPVVENVDVEPRDPLDLVVVIHVSRNK